MTKSVMELGQYVGDGWQQLLQELHAELSAVEPDYEVMQIKEKFGTLRVYLKDHIYTDATRAIVRKYEQLSGTICQDCGASGHLRDGGWMLTLCNACAALRGRN